MFLLAGNIEEFGAETMHKVLAKKSFGNRLLGRCRGWDDYVNIGEGKWFWEWQVRKTGLDHVWPILKRLITLLAGNLFPSSSCLWLLKWDYFCWFVSVIQHFLSTREWTIKYWKIGRSVGESSLNRWLLAPGASHNNGSYGHFSVNRKQFGT